MNNEEFTFMYDSTEQTSTRFVCFFKNTIRFDFAIITTDRYFGKKIVIDLQNGKSAIIGPDDLAEEGYIEHVFKLKDEEATELREFLDSIVGTIHFTDI
jgi:hypothetical protein